MYDHATYLYGAYFIGIITLAAFMAWLKLQQLQKQKLLTALKREE